MIAARQIWYRQLSLTIVAIIWFSQSTFSQIDRSEGDDLKRAELNYRFGKDGIPILHSPNTNTFARHPVDFDQRNSLRTHQHQPMLPDSSIFEPVTGPFGGTVRGITLDSDGWLFAATDGEVYRSTDDGSSWSINLFPSQLHSSVVPVTILGPNVVVAETDFDDYISTNRGDSWNRLYEDVQGFAVDTNGVIYAGSTNSGVKISTDTAKSWSSFALPGRKIWRVVLCGEGKIICPSDSGNYFSTDGGISWVFQLYTTFFTWNLVGDRAGRLFVLRYFGANFQVYRSVDFGISWQQMTLPPGSDPYEDAYRIYAEKDHQVFVVTNQRVIRSTDGGNTWTSITPPVRPLTVGRDTDGNLLVGTFYGIYRRNAANEWEEINNGIRAFTIGQILFPPKGSIITQTLKGWFRSDDDGGTWSQMQFDSSLGDVYGPMLIASSGNLFLSAHFENQSGLIRSDDNGNSWTRISVLSNYWAIRDIVEGASGDILVSNAFGDIYRSTNNGNTWSKVVPSSSQSEIRTLVTDKWGNYYATKEDSVLISGDGVIWKRVLLERPYSSHESISIDSRLQVFLGTSWGVYHSPDTGKSWSTLNAGLLDGYIMSTASDTNGNVFLGTGSGVFRLADSVDRWVSFRSGLPRSYTTTLAVSPDNFLFAGFQNYGIYKTKAPLSKRIPKIELPPSPNAGITDFRLHQNYPNPFNGQTEIRYDVPFSAKVEITIYNVLGQKVANLVSSELAQGTYDAFWAPQQSASGVYFCRMIASSASGTYESTIKLLYVR